MSYIQLPYGKVEKDNKTIKLTNFPRNTNVSVLFPKFCYLNVINDTEFQRSIIRTNKNRQHLKPYLLASGELGKSIQDYIYMVVTEVRLNDAQVRQMLDPVCKNVLRKQNLLEIVFKDIFKFNAQIP